MRSLIAKFLPYQCQPSGALRLGRLQQVASNLLANALTHGLPDSPIRFTASDDGHYLVLEVWNAGAPIPAPSLSKIFEPFWRHASLPQSQWLRIGAAYLRSDRDCA
jgi:signal transduction histidine kinase